MRGMPSLGNAFIPTLGSDVELADKCFAALDKKVTSQPAATTQPSDIVVHERKNRQQWIVVECVEKQNVTETDYKQNRNLAENYLLNERRSEVLKYWFSNEQILARIDWKEAEVEQKPAEQQTEESDKTQEQENQES